MKTKHKKRSGREPIAIIGMGCRFPGGANHPEAFWNLMKAGTDAMIDVPPDRWDWRRFYDPDPDKPGKMYIRQAGFLREPIDRFDAQFFGISPREASLMDPQQRLLLEVTWEALEDAGLPIESVKGSDTGVYIGAFNLDNSLSQLSIHNRHLINAHTATSGSMTLLANRISHVFDFRGPSVSMDTACSASLVALHYACQGLWNGDYALAVAGGANVISRPEFSIVMSKGRYLSPDGRCKTFDAAADGYGRGEGAGIVVLKRLGEALADGDPIYALVRGSGINQDGHTPGIMLPNSMAQETLLRQVYRQTGIEPRHISYVEAHGTGTQAGDTAEASAIGAVLGKRRSKDHPCILGSIKTNIGHLEAAAGIAGIIKTVLCLYHKAIPPNLHFRTPNPDIPFETLKLQVPQTLAPWPEYGKTRMAGVNSFGYGGTNAHVVLEAFDPDESAPAGNGETCGLGMRAPSNSAPDQSHKDNGKAMEQGLTGEKMRPVILPLSARSRDALLAVARSYVDFLAERPVSLQDLYHALTVRRSHHSHRLAVIAPSPDHMRDQLAQYTVDEPPLTLLTGRTTMQGNPALVFVYTGMGTQWGAMGRELLATEPVFRDAVERCDHLFKDLAGWSLLDAWMTDEPGSRMDQPEVAQPVNFALQIGLTELWRSWGFIPGAVVGHSVGEVAAACVAGALDLEQAVRVSYHRSRLQQTLNGAGRMLATGLSPDQVTDLLADLEGLISIAGINSRSSVVLAGDPVALEEIADFLDRRAIFQRFIHVQVAYHSHQMEPLQQDLLESLKDLVPQQPALPLYSTVTGSRVTDAAVDADYWWNNVRQPVRMADALNSLIGDGYHAFIETGPHPVLAPYIREELKAHRTEGYVYASLHRKKPERTALMETVGRLYCDGYAVDWLRLSSGPGRYVKLPGYPWQRDAYSQESEAAREDRVGSGVHPLLDRRTPVRANVWETEISLSLFPYMKDHCISDTVIFPGAAYVEIGLALDRVRWGERPTVIEDIVFHRALILEDRINPVLQVEENDRDHTFTVAATTEERRGQWTVHASGTLLRGEMGETPEPLDLEHIRQRCVNSLDMDAQYRELYDRGYHYGPKFKRGRQIRTGGAEVLAEIDCETTDPAYRLHPTLLDSAFQTLMATLDRRKAQEVYVPVEIDRVAFYRTPGPTLWSYGRLTMQTPEVITGDVTLCDEDGQVVAAIRGLRYRTLPMARKASVDRLEQWFYAYRWEATDLFTLIGAADRSAARIDWATTGVWLIFMDGEGVGDTLADALVANGATGIRVTPGAHYAETAPGGFQISRDHPEDVTTLVETVGGDRIRGVVYLWGLDGTSEPNYPVSDSRDCVTVAALVRALASRSGPFRLTLVTRRAQSVEGEPISHILNATLWGLGRVIANEHPELGLLLVDLDDEKPNHDGWMALLVGDHGEEEVAVRRGTPYVHRLIQGHPAQDIRRSGEKSVVPVELEVGQPGVIDSLRLRTMRRRAPGAGEVEIQVHTAALNFKDVMKVMGLLSHSILEGTFFGNSLGMECSGVITATGPGVNGFQIGDEVIAATGVGCFRSYLTIDIYSAFIVHKPAAMDLSEAPVLVPYMTAYYSLMDVARLEPGERVLIHAATGGVGLAAVYCAQAMGAEIFATAGAPEKRDYLTSLGIRHVSDSRTLKFADDIMAWTEGRGVDVVLNALSGEAMTRSLKTLAPYGRFIEIGKRDIDENNPLSMRVFNRNMTFSSVDLDRLVIERRETVARVLDAVRKGWADGRFKPLPTRMFPVTEAAEAFRYMGQARHIGKVMVSMQAQAGDVSPLPACGPAITADGTYLVTGGCGGFGLATARWLADRGARHLVLVGRSGASSAALAAVAEMEAMDVTTRILQVDVADPEQVDRLIDDIRSTMPPLKGIIHAAGVLADAPITRLDTGAFETVFAPKVSGAWQLHRSTRSLDLDYFILYSSVSALVGHMGQGNYAAANAFLDALAHYRRAQGLPATSINWGALSEVGMAARTPGTLEFLERVGMRSFTPSQALEGLGRVIEQNPAQIGVMDVDWSQWEKTQISLSRSPRFYHLVSALKNGHANGRVNTLLQILSRMEEVDRRQVLQNLIARQVARVLRMPPEKLDIHQSLMDMGMDSLTGFELLTVIQTAFGVDISPMELMRGISVVQLSRKLYEKLPFQETGIPEGEKPETPEEAESILAHLMQAGMDK